MPFAYSLEEVSRLTGVSRSNLIGGISLGQGPKARKCGSKILILEKDLEEWLRSLPETRITDLGTRHCAGRQD